ncbi:MAG: O-antigen ligase domain-containing protein [Cyanothece sp. SIO2G6]|nr:O-antigen ligase domain-containing protein [Cyanothece sp. SIO2G6]
MTVPLMLYGILPFTLLLFRWLPAQRAVLISSLAAFLFLPQSSTSLPIIPDYDRTTGIVYSIGLGLLLFDIDRLKCLKLGWIDIPMLVWCWSPLAASVSNDLGIYDGVLASLNDVVAWGGPYLIGRLYFGSLEGIKRLAVGFFVGGLIYVPFCLYEIQMSPQLHNMFYGFHGGAFGQSIRYGGYRPIVFLNHGLQVGSWMMSAALVGIWLWKSGTVKHILGIPIKWLVALQCFMVILVKSTGAIILLGFGTILIFISHWMRVSILVWLIVLTVPTYLYFATSGDLETEQVVEFVAETVNPDRARSLGFRLSQEEVLSEKARERFLFGWAGWDRFSTYDEWNGEKNSVTDSLWIIAFGTRGVLGLTSMALTLLMPVVVVLLLYPAEKWADKRLAPVVILAMILLLYTLDNLLNDMYVPIYTVASGAVTGMMMMRTPKTQGRGVSLTERYLPQLPQSKGFRFKVKQR